MYMPHTMHHSAMHHPHWHAHQHLALLKVLLVLLMMLIAWEAAGQAPVALTQDDLFSDTQLQEIRLTMNPADWQAFKDNYTKDDYYKASLSWRGITVDEIGVRQRGTASRSGVKPYIGIDFKRYRSAQRFLGLTGLRLKNMIQDGSLMHERLSMMLFRRMNIAAPREGYGRVYMNDDYIGLYIIIEEIDANFLQNSFGDGGGFLLEYVRLDDWHLEYLGADPELYVPARFDVKTRKSEFNAATIVEMIDVINHAPDEEFAASVSRYLDMSNVLRYVAVENYLAEWDGFLGHGGMNNYYFYQTDAHSPFRMVAWDKEQGFGIPDHPVFYNAELNVLMRRSLENAELREYYLNALRRITLEAGGYDGWLLGLAEQFYSQIWAAVLEDPQKLTSNADFESGMLQIRSNIPQRYAYLMGEVGGQRAPSLLSVVNGASFYAPPLAAGGIATIFGQEMAFTSVAAHGGQLPNTLGSTQVLLNGEPVPLLFASPERLDFQVPWGLSGTSTAGLIVAVGGMTTDPVTLQLAGAAPGVFSLNRTGSGQGAVLNAQSGLPAAPRGSIPGVATDAVHGGDFIAIYATGLGAVWPAPADGQPPAALTATLETPMVTVGGVPATVVFAGLAPGIVGVYQINAVVPDDAPVGDAVAVVVEAGGSLSNEVQIAVR
jgi:uncharacterized protein (TIGR03437 family)